MIYNKLVRDKIPEIIEKSGKKAKYRVLEGDELKAALKNKLVEEANELLNAETEEEIIEEIADVLEVLDGILMCFGGVEIESKVYQKAMQKYKEKGRFEKGYYLESVEAAENDTDTTDGHK